MPYRCFDVDVVDRVAHVVMSRPEKRNSMIAGFWDELPAIVEGLDEQAEARAIVISSTGAHFTSGLDLSLFQDGGLDGLGGTGDRCEPAEEIQRGARLYQTIRRMQRTFSCLESCRLPVLAAIQGGCIGGGVDLITACDMRYASEDAFIVIQEINLGLTADVGTYPRIARIIPDGIARELAYTGRRMSASEACGAGLVNRVFADAETLREEVTKIACEIARKAPLAVYGTKRMMNYARDHRTDDALDYVALWNAGMLSLEEIDEAMAANAQGREARFAGLPPLSRPRKP